MQLLCDHHTYMQNKNIYNVAFLVLWANKFYVSLIYERTQKVKYILQLRFVVLQLIYCLWLVQKVKCVLSSSGNIPCSKSN